MRSIQFKNPLCVNAAGVAVDGSEGAPALAAASVNTVESLLKITLLAVLNDPKALPET
jgi:hypothetical protein